LPIVDTTAKLEAAAWSYSRTAIAQCCPSPSHPAGSLPGHELEAGLRRPGDLTLWLDEDALANWTAQEAHAGRPALCADLAAELVLESVAYHPSIMP
jgi:hypothetical protein